MRTLDDIQAAVDALSLKQKRELFLFLRERLRAQRAPVPHPRRFGPEQLAKWIGEDEADARRVREGQ